MFYHEKIREDDTRKRQVSFIFFRVLDQYKEVCASTMPEKNSFSEWK